ncbi:MAG: alpha-L-rhamnosidase [Citrobacter freundii]|nr:MAG: alpha-L-rhamnosidase [Citrobacter freundii]
MKKIFLLASSFLALAVSALAQLAVTNPLCENRHNPIGLDITQPRFSWQLSSAQRNTQQTAYELIVETASSGKKTVVYNSGRISSDQSVHVPYKGQPLESGKRYFWRVRVWDNHGQRSNWTEPAFWQMALLQAGDWKAKWIVAGGVEDSVMRPSPLFRKAFNTSKKIRASSLYITSHGLYEAFINGKRVGEDFLTPGWTSYNKRLQYQVYDVTDLVRTGNNAIGVQLGSGWYRGTVAWNGRDFYGKKLALLAQLAVTYTDGTTETIISDDQWRSSVGAVQYSEIYHGEINDARKEKNGWNNTGYDDAGWNAVQTADLPMNILLATYNEPVRQHEQFKPIKIFKTPKGELVADFGQNLTGFVELKVQGKAGDSIKIYHAEVLDKAGNFYTENLRVARQENTYILRGNGEESFHPHFTFQGFRYIRVEGFPGELKPENLTAVALYSDMPATGSFTSSHALLNQLQHNIQWGQNGNFLDVPTDCPQRDERLGWTGDAQVFARTASFNRKVDNFFSKWLKDVSADQHDDGSVPYVIPDVLNKTDAGSAGWADVATIIPWTMYIAYGDTGILSQQYNSMKAWVQYVQKNSPGNLWNTGNHFGDWLFYRPFDDNDGRSAVTDKVLIAQSFYAYSVQLLIKAATVLGKTEDVQTYTALLPKIKEAFVKEFVTPAGRLVSSTQTAYVLALNFDMLPENLRAQAAARLVENIKSYGTHLTTGFLGTPYLCHVLSRFGYTDWAYKLLLQESYPSWLYPVKMGATTIWERWNGIRTDGSFEPASMNSFNHYAYGAIGDWMYRVAAGLDTYEDGPGYKHIRIQPHIGGGLTDVAASLKTYYGNASSHWKVQDKQLQFEIEIPVNTTATIYIPGVTLNSVLENGKPLSSFKEIKNVRQENADVVMELGSGKYVFTAGL